MDVRTSERVSSNVPSDEAAFPFGPSTRRRTATLFTFANATSMVDISVSATMNRAAMKTSVPLNIEIFAANDVLRSSSRPYRFRGRIPSSAAVHAERDGGHLFQN